MKVAVIGSGISGLAATWFLSKHHQVTLIEKGASIGMDAHSVEVGGGSSPVYINAPMRVFFEAYYPALTQLYQEIGAEYEPVRYSGSFSEQDGAAYFQYKNYWLGRHTVPFLASRSLLSANAWQLGWELIRFIRRVHQLDYQSLPDTLSIGDFLKQAGISTTLTDGFIYPAFAGICTCSYDQVKAYPARIILDYLGRDLTFSRVNRLSHGVQDVVQRLSAAAARVRCGVELKTIRPEQGRVVISDGDAFTESFDHVVVAVQANHAASLLPEAMAAERDALTSFHYQQSRLIVHRDTGLAPRDRRDWGPVNFVLGAGHDKPMASIWLNSIYPELGDTPLFETWNPLTDVAAEDLLIDALVERPVVTADSLAAIRALQQMRDQNGTRVWFCGSYANEGIPLLESAVTSARQVASHLAQ